MPYTPQDYIKEWCQKKSYKNENLFVKQLRESLDDGNIAVVLSVIDATCPYCFDSDRRCFCEYND